MRCDHSVCSTYHKSQDCTDCIVKLFSKLTLEGNVHAAVCLVTEHAGGGFWILILWFQQGRTIPLSALPCCDTVPLFEDVEVNGAQVQAVACRIQGDAGPGGCDDVYWHDALRHYGAHSEHLRDSVAAIAHCLCNTIMPWNDVHVLFASQLNSLEMCWNKANRDW